MNFDVDIFISYAHIDNEALADAQEGWVSALHRVLEIRLAQLLGEKPRIWRDPKLQGNDVFDQTIIQRLDRSRTLISIISPRYVKSEWCLREAKEFVKVAEETGGISVADKARVFKVVKTPVPLEEHPPDMQALLGYQFFEVDPNTGRAREFNKIFGPEAERRYYDKLEDLACDICNLLELMRTKSPTASTGNSGMTVYLAETTFDLSDERDRIRRELLERGHTVLPDRPLPLRSPDLDARVRSDLERAALTVHLIGENFGIVPEAATRSVNEIQNALAIERSRDSTLRRLIWLPPGVTGRDDRQRDFIERLMNDSSVDRNADLLQTSLEELKTILEDRLAPRKPEQISSSETASDDKPPLLLYLLCDRNDMDAVASLEDWLFDQGLEVRLPLTEGDEADIREDHEENLRLADAVLIYYGDTTEAWVRAKLRDLRKAPGLGRALPFRVTAVVVAGPDGARKARFRTHEVDIVVPALEGFSRELLKPFMDKLSDARRLSENSAASVGAGIHPQFQ